MANRFYFGDDSATPTTHSDADGDITYTISDYDDNDDDTTTLPFPEPLSRPQFLTPDFEPHAFLASLSTSNRFQTLEDLQSELRALSAKTNKELVDLVNANYAEFVSLGADLRGGDERVEEVRVGLLGFEKEVRAIRERVVKRREEVLGLVERKREVRREIGLGRGLLEVDERLGELEGLVGGKGRERERRKSFVTAATTVNEDEPGAGEVVEWSSEWDDDEVGESDEEYEDEDEDVVTGRTRSLVDKYLIVKTLVRQYDSTHPFLVGQRERIQRIQDRVRLEVETAIRGANELSVKQKLIQMRARMDE